jgi:hypothetical protein
MASTDEGDYALRHERSLISLTPSRRECSHQASSRLGSTVGVVAGSETIGVARPGAQWLHNRDGGGHSGPAPGSALGTLAFRTTLHRKEAPSGPRPCVPGHSKLVCAKYLVLAS